MYLKKNKVVETKVCCACNLEKPINYFYRNARLETGYEKRCKVCKRNKVKCRKSAEEKRERVGRPNLRDAPQLYNVKKKDWVEMYNFLKKIGYDLTKNIHEQFCKKHNLKPRKIGYDKTIKYTPKDLGIID